MTGLELQTITRPQIVPFHRTIVLGRADDRDIDAALDVVRRPRSSRAAAFRLLAHRITRQHPELRALMVTAPGPGRSKSLVAANLAAALGEIPGLHPVVIDLDFRSPQISSLFGLAPCSEGLLAHLEATAPRILKLAVFDNLSLAIVPLESRATRFALRDASRLGQLFDDLYAGGFGPVVVDGPPTLGNVEANLVLEVCDGAVVTVDAGRSRAHDLHATQEQLRSSPIVATVLHHA